MGGTITLASTLGVGSTITVTLPFDLEIESSPTSESFESSAESSSSRASSVSVSPVIPSEEFASSVPLPYPTPSLKGSNKRQRMDPSAVSILVAEDNDLIRSILIKTLEKMRFKVGE